VERDELQELWQAQAISTEVPRFGALDDLTTPVHNPLSRGIRWSNAAVLAYFAVIGWRDIGRGAAGFELASLWVVIVTCLGGALALLLPLWGQPQPEPPAEASLLEYRAATAREYARQSSAERRIYIPMLGIVWAAIIVRATAQWARTGFEWYHLILPVLFAILFGMMVWHTRQVRRRALRRIMSGL
jgi:hypothetical protein